jgi:hypothetical protein
VLLQSSALPRFTRLVMKEIYSTVTRLEGSLAKIYKANSRRFTPEWLIQSAGVARV